MCSCGTSHLPMDSFEVKTCKYIHIFNIKTSEGQEKTGGHDHLLIDMNLFLFFCLRSITSSLSAASLQSHSSWLSLCAFRTTTSPKASSSPPYSLCRGYVRCCRRLSAQGNTLHVNTCEPACKRPCGNDRVLNRFPHTHKHKKCDCLRLGVTFLTYSNLLCNLGFFTCHSGFRFTAGKKWRECLGSEFNHSQENYLYSTFWQRASLLLHCSPHTLPPNTGLMMVS